VLSIDEQTQSQLLPHALLEEELVAVENEVARKMILTGGPDSRRVTFHGMTRNSGCTFSGLLYFGVESCFTSCSGAPGEKSHGRTLSITIFPKE